MATEHKLDVQIVVQQRAEWIASLDLRCRITDPSEHARFVGAIHAAEMLGYRVEITVKRDKEYDIVDSLVAMARRQ